MALKPWADLAQAAPHPSTVTAPSAPGTAPESEAAARWRLALLRPHLPVAVAKETAFIGGNSNDAWLLDDAVLRVAWRADRVRLLREAAVLESLPADIPHARLLDAGLVEGMSWTLAERVAGLGLFDLDAYTPEGQAPVAAQLAEILGRLHAWEPPSEVSSLLDAVADTADGWSAYGKQLIPYRPKEFLTIAELVRGLPHVDVSLINAAIDRFQSLAVHQPLEAEPQVVVHDDPMNVLVKGGRITALLDFEWVRRGPVDLELVVPRFLAHWRPALGPWPDELARHDSGLIAYADHEERMWLYGLAFAMRGVLWWPPEGPEETLDPTHHLRLLRHLVASPFIGTP